MNCSTTGLQTFTPRTDNTWDAAAVRHLHRRLGYGANLPEIAAALERSPEQEATQLLETAAAQPLPPAPRWANWNEDRFLNAGQDAFAAYRESMDQLLDLGITYGVREKIVFFWHDHFATRYETHNCPSYHHQYFDVLTRNAFGNFRTLVKEVTVTPAMLYFLNGFENRRDKPNENYARELFELFTLGENNGYTQEDIREASRALTGWNGYTSYGGPIEWKDNSFDDGLKTVFGRTGSYDTNGLIDVLFEARGAQIADFVCRKLYRAFVNPTADEAIVEALAATLLQHGFELLPVMRQLFTSAHFFDRANRGVLVKSPVELMLSFLRQGEFGDFENRREWGFWGIASLGQQPGEPPDVAGWPGNRAWINSNRLTLRWEFLDGFGWAVHDNNQRTYPDWAIRLTGNSTDPAEVTRAIIDFFLPQGLSHESAYQEATAVLKGEIPENYFANGKWSLSWDSASWQIYLLLRHLIRLPEFQLC